MRPIFSVWRKMITKAMMTSTPLKIGSYPSSKKWMAGNTAKVISPTIAAVTLENEIMLVR